jgi:hypothetical protein
LSSALRQFLAARSGSLLEHPVSYGADIRHVEGLTLVPTTAVGYLVNVDGVRMPAAGATTIRVSGAVSLVRAPD